MKHMYWLAAIAALLLTGDGYAAPAQKDGQAAAVQKSGAATAGKKGEKAAKTRQDAIAKVKEQLAKLEKMTDQEWAAQQKKRAAERAAERAERRAAKKTGGKEKPKS